MSRVPFIPLGPPPSERLDARPKAQRSDPSGQNPFVDILRSRMGNDFAQLEEFSLAGKLLSGEGKEGDEGKSAFDTVMNGEMKALSYQAMATVMRMKSDGNPTLVNGISALGNGIPALANGIPALAKGIPGGFSLNALLGELTKMGAEQGGVADTKPNIAVGAASQTKGRAQDVAAELKAGAAIGKDSETVRIPESVTGLLSALFESGADGGAAIGWDRVGGTSYGKFQLSSKAGSMDAFMRFLSKRVPEWAEALKAAGPADTGSRSGAMPDAWRKLAGEHGVSFDGVQDEFIRTAHYMPAVRRIMEATGLDVEGLSLGLRESLLSTSVQHGSTGAARLFTRVIQSLGVTPGQNADKDILQEAYRIRKSDFPSSTPAVREAVGQRLDKEMAMALQLLDDSGKSGT
jgi:hypothetical protein